MRQNAAYLYYLLLHKWYVFWECLRLRVPLYRAIIHDWTKFTPTEWGPYVQMFINPDGTKRKVRDASGAYDPNAQPVDFRRAWLNHQRNPHHWQAWISIGDGGSLDALPIPNNYAREMVADWAGASRVYSGVANPNVWYTANRDKIILHIRSRVMVEDLLARYYPAQKDKAK